MRKKMKLLVPFFALTLVFGMMGMASAEINTTVKDFRVTLDRSTTSTSQGINGVVELLDENGKVDVLADTEGYYIELDVGSVLGEVYTSNFDDTDYVEFYGGKARFHIDYNMPGTDTVRISVVIYNTQYYSSWYPGIENLVIGPKDFQVDITQSPNDATSLQLERLTAPEAGDNKDKTDYSSNPGATDDTSGQIDAGQPFTLKVQAKNGDSDTDNQTSEVTATFIGTSEIDSDGNMVMDSPTDCVVKTVTGQMTNGVALINVPAGTLTEAGQYRIFLSTPSSAALAGIAKQENDGYTLFVDAVEPAKVAGTLTPACLNDTGNPSDPMQLTVKLLDQYGNLADTNDVLSDSDVDLSATNHVLLEDGSNGTVTIVAGANSATYSTFDVDEAHPPTIGTDGTASSTLTLASDDYDVDEPDIAITIYEKKLVGDYNVAQSYTAGGVLDDAINVGLAADGDATYDPTDADLDGQPDNNPFTDLVGKKVKVDLYDPDVSETMPIDSVVSTVTVSGTVNLRFTKANEATADGDEYFKISYASTDMKYQPSALDPDTITVEAADANSIKVYKEASADYDPCAGTGTALAEVDSISILESDGDWPVTVFGGSQDAADHAGVDYFVKIEDPYGNERDGNVFTESNTDPLNPVFTPDSDGNFAIGDTNGITATYAKAGTDVLTFSTDIPGVDPVSVDVTAVETVQHQLTTIEVLPGSDYALTNGAIPFTVKAFDENGDPIAASNVVYLISDPNLARVDDYTTGEFVNIGQEKTFYLLPYNTAGDVTLTFRNADGSVTGSATVHIVESLGEIPAAVAAVTPAATSLDMIFGQEASMVFTVTDADGNPLAGKTVTFSSDNEGIVTAGSSAVTDAAGQVTADLTAGNVEGSAHVTATSEGISGTVNVSVAETIPATEVGGGAGAVTADVNTTDNYELLLNITNSAGVAPADIAQEWLVFGANVGGVDSGVFFWTDSGIMDYAAASADPAAATFTFDHSADTFNPFTGVLGSLGLSSGDYLWYGYAYSTTAVTDFANAPDLVFENYTVLNVQ